MFVRGRMTVNELLVNEIKATGGDILVSVADLEILDVTTTPDNDYKCTFDTQDGTVRNPLLKVIRLYVKSLMVKMLKDIGAWYPK